MSLENPVEADEWHTTTYKEARNYARNAEKWGFRKGIVFAGVAALALSYVLSPNEITRHVDPEKEKPAILQLQGITQNILMAEEFEGKYIPICDYIRKVYFFEATMYADRTKFDSFFPADKFRDLRAQYLYLKLNEHLTANGIKSASESNWKYCFF